MKPDDIRRAVRSTHRERAVGDTPSMGRVARMPGTGLPKSKRKGRTKSRRNRTRRARKRVIATWSLFIGIVAAASLSISIWLGLTFKTNQGEAESKPSMASIEDGKRVDSMAVSLSEKEALALVRNGLAVRDEARLSEFFRQGDVSPTDEIRFLRELESKDGKIDHLEWLGSLDANGLSIDGVLVVFQSELGSRNRLAELVPDPQGKWKIDFDSFARAATPAWQDFLEGRTEIATVRVYVIKDNYYNGVFADEDEWLSVGIASPDIDALLTGYCHKKSSQGAALGWIFSRDSEINRVFLEIRRVEGGGSRQVLISKMLAEDWVMGDAAFDQRFE
jgi:hypothetical protein